MEKEFYFDKNLSFSKSRLIETSSHMKNKNYPVGSYAFDSGAKIINNFLPDLVKNLEGFTGPIYSIEGGRENPLPEKWQAMADYFRRNKIISSINFDSFYCDEPKIIRTTVNIHPDYKKFLQTDGSIPAYGMSAHGDSENVDEAIAKLFGEMLERYPLLIYRDKELLRASIKTLLKKKKIFLDPRMVSGFSGDQKNIFSGYQFNKESLFCWTEGKSLFSGKKALIPSQLIFWNYNFQKYGWREPAIREQNTNGAGGHYALTKAILGGLYELIQRDGFLIYWLNGLSLQKIKNDSIEYEPLKNLLEDCQDLGLEVVFLNTMTELGVPSCICLVLDHSETGPKVSLGGGCESDWSKALYRSLIETLGVYHWIRLKKTELGEKYPYLEKIEKPFRDVSINQLKRLTLWANEKMFDKIKFFLEGEEIDLNELTKNQIKFTSPKKELEYLTEKFRSLGKEYEIFYYQAKHKMLDELGYFSVKVIVPALVPLYLREIYAPMGARRLKEVPPKIGFSSSKEWNPWPHPFP
jgi:ribosomal protein S12 methylthiotransferase accessory factor